MKLNTSIKQMVSINSDITLTTLPESTKFLQQYQGLVLSAGGEKGLLELGVLQEFWNRGQLTNLTHYAGSSIGSVISFLLSVGYSPLEITIVSCQPDFSSLFNSINFKNLSELYGLYPNNLLYDKLYNLVMLKLGYSPSFKELYQKMNKFVLIPVYCISQVQHIDRKQYCCPETTPDMKIIDAVILSCTIPIIFQKAVYENNVYIDGAYTSTFPLQKLQTYTPANCNLLGIYLEKIDYKLDTFMGYCMSILSIPFDDQNNLDCVNDHSDIIKITTNNDITFNFALSIHNKISLYSSAHKQMKRLFEKWTEDTDVD